MDGEEKPEEQKTTQALPEERIKDIWLEGVFEQGKLQLSTPKINGFLKMVYLSADKGVNFFQIGFLNWNIIIDNTPGAQKYYFPKTQSHNADPVNNLNTFDVTEYALNDELFIIMEGTVGSKYRLLIRFE